MAPRECPSAFKLDRELGLRGAIEIGGSVTVISAARVNTDHRLRMVSRMIRKGSGRNPETYRRKKPGTLSLGSHDFAFDCLSTKFLAGASIYSVRRWLRNPVTSFWFVFRSRIAALLFDLHLTEIVHGPYSEHSAVREMASNTPSSITPSESTADFFELIDDLWLGIVSVGSRVPGFSNRLRIG